MEGLQKEIRLQHLALKPHLLLEGPLRADLDSVAQKVRESLGVEAVDVQLKLQVEGLLEPLRDTKIIMGSGVVIEGSSDITPGTIVIGGELATSVDAENMEAFQLRNVWNLEGAPLELKLGGIRRSGLFDVDRFYVWVAESDLQKWLGNGNYKSRIEVILKDPFLAPTLVSQVKSIDPQFRDWTELDFALWHSLDLEKKAMAFALFFVVLFGALAVSSSLSLRIAEKRREIGLLRAIGATQSEIFWIFELEAILLASFAFILGVAIAGAASWAIENWAVLPRFFLLTKSSRGLVMAPSIFTLRNQFAHRSARKRYPRPTIIQMGYRFVVT